MQSPAGQRLTLEAIPDLLELRFFSDELGFQVGHLDAVLLELRRAILDRSERLIPSMTILLISSFLLISPDRCPRLRKLLLGGNEQQYWRSGRTTKDGADRIARGQKRQPSRAKEAQLTSVKLFLTFFTLVPRCFFRSNNPTSSFSNFLESLTSFSVNFLTSSNAASLSSYACCNEEISARWWAFRSCSSANSAVSESWDVSCALFDIVSQGGSGRTIALVVISTLLVKVFM
jgi:hypothetical protein